MAALHLFCLDPWEARSQAPVLSQVSGGYQQVSCEALVVVHLITGASASVSSPLDRKQHCRWTDLSGRQLAAFIHSVCRWGGRDVYTKEQERK